MHGSGTPQDKDINDFTQISSADLRSILREDLNSAEPDRLSVDEIKIIVGLLKQREDDEFNFESNDTIIQDRITAEESKMEQNRNLLLLGSAFLCESPLQLFVHF